MEQRPEAGVERWIIAQCACNTVEELTLIRAHTAHEPIGNGNDRLYYRATL